MAAVDFDPAILASFRSVFFPAIVSGQLTGFNVYRERPRSAIPYLVNYLHSDLGLLPDGSPHPHRSELLDKLQQFGQVNILPRLTESIVDRMAIYKVGDWEENPEGLNYYNAEGNPLPVDQLQSYEGLLIVEGKQYDLGIEASTRRDLERILGVLNKYTYMNRVGRRGRILDEENPKAITGAWKIPLVTVTTDRRQKINGFAPISDIAVAISDHEACAIVLSPDPLFQYLASQGLSPAIMEKRVNTPFLKNYLEAT